MHRILVADDNRDFTDLVKEYISLCDDVELVGVAENGSATYELLLENRPDVLMLDLVMPNMDGLELLRRIRNVNGIKPVIFVISALNSEALAREALTLGACAYFTKPVNLASILSRIRALA